MSSSSRADRDQTIHKSLQSRLRIFLSVDLVNSTAFKQSRRFAQEKASQPEPTEHRWFSAVSGFYHGIQSRFANEWRRVSGDQNKNIENSCNENHQSPPELWKISGDELIYTKILVGDFEALACIHAWMATVEHHRKELKQSYPLLDLKASAWLAGFPLNNTEIVLLHKLDEGAELSQRTIQEDDWLFSNFSKLEAYYSGNDEKKYILDFIGPSMDTGFRIATLASPRKFAVSVDLAYMLATTTNSKDSDENLLHRKELPFRYDGRIALKGVNGGDPYPFFWIDMKDDDLLSRTEDDLLLTASILPHKVVAFCNNYLEAGDGHIMKPYIFESGKKFNGPPVDHTKRLLRLEEKLSEYISGARENEISEDSDTSQRNQLEGEIENKLLDDLLPN